MGVMAPERTDASEEAALIEAARSGRGGEAAFARLYERHKDAAWGFLLQLTGDRGVAEDALQEAFLRAWRHLHRFEAGRSFRPWLLTLARHAAIDLERARGKEARTVARIAPGTTPEKGAVEREAAREETRRRARAALAALPLETRALLVQRHGMGLKLEELAASFDVTERTVRNRLRAAAERLALALSVVRDGRDA